MSVDMSCDFRESRDRRGFRPYNFLSPGNGGGSSTSPARDQRVPSPLPTGCCGTSDGQGSGEDVDGSDRWVDLGTWMTPDTRSPREPETKGGHGSRQGSHWQGVGVTQVRRGRRQSARGMGRRKKKEEFLCPDSSWNPQLLRRSRRNSK